MSRYKCRKCGYVYYPSLGDEKRGIPKDTPFENLPKEWVCPVCGATKDFFIKAGE